MFKPNGNQDRCNYSDLLMPPDGYQLEKAVGTTYSLDLEALTAVAICLGLSEETDSKIMQNPISMLNALQRVSDKISVFCEAGQIKTPSKSSALSIILEKIVVPIGLPKDKKTGRYPAFHPKTWTLCYVNKDGDRKYRFVVMSRNLTFDRSWDICFAMDNSNQIMQNAKTKPILDFLEYLRHQVKNTSQFASKKRNMIAGLKNELESVSFAIESKEFGEDFQILPMGIGENACVMEDNVLFCKDCLSADYTFHELVIMSPFLTGSVIEAFNKTDRGLKNCKRTLITRKSELSKMKASQVNNFDIYALKDDIVDGEEYLSDEAIDKQLQDIHAKIYLRRKYADVDLYFGSMNASYAAINKNVEMMIWLGTKNRYLNSELFLKDIFCGPAEGENNPFQKVNVVEAQEDIAGEEKEALELVIKDLCRVKKKAIITEKQGKYRVDIEFNGVIENKDIQISPFNSKRKESLKPYIVFNEMELLQLSEFYEVIAHKGDSTLSRIIMIPTSGFPEEREAAVVNSVVKDRKSFVEYVAFVLGDDYLMSLMDGRQMGESGFFRLNKEVMPALYEKMLKTSLEAPERIKDIEYILKMVSDKNIIPDEFRETYEIFCKTLKMK